MKKSTTIMLQKKEIEPTEKVQEKVLAKKFFPPYASKIKNVLNIIYSIHPKTSCWITAKLFSITRRKKLSNSDKEFYIKGLKRKFKIGSATFFTYTYGKGPAILMLHGWCSNGARWRAYVSELVNSGYKVVIIDAPGHGNAPGRFLSVSLYVLGIKSILKSESKWHAVIAHSIGTLTGITAIGNSEKKYHPKKFIMMNTFATLDAMVDQFSECLGISKKVIKGTKKWVSNYTDCPLEQLSIKKHYTTINAKGLLIYDTEDIVVPRREPEYIVSHIKPLQFIKTKGLGHNLRSNRIVQEVVNFIKSDTDESVKPKETTKNLMAVCI